MKSVVNIRKASVADEVFILSLVPRLVEFEPPVWRDAERMVELDGRILSEKLNAPSPDEAIFIAEDENGTRLGFIDLQTGKDFYHQEQHGHISNVIVAPEGKGRGIGSLLIEKGEEWAHEKGYAWLTLSVFAQNLSAREVYERLGFGQDIMKYVKQLA